MQITFVSNYINHHQIPLSDELYRLTNGSYTFIQTEPMDKERVNMGWDINSINKPYVRLLYEEEEECKALILESECVIFGGAENENLIKPRLEKDKFTIRYSERLYKDGRWKFISPRGLVKKYKDHTKYRNANVYLLCAGAYVKGDYNLICAYPNKKLKFGYFPAFEKINELDAMRKGNDKLEILWAGRFIDWKHPEVMLELAHLLKQDDVNAHITMIGDGDLLCTIKDRARDYTDYISFAGALGPLKVREEMKKADLFISTSDQREGWGAVINEAMNSGCLTIAAKKIGAAPYLIKEGHNGFLYKACDCASLYEIVSYCINNPLEVKKIAACGYEAIEKEWNPQIAASRLYNFITDKSHKIGYYTEGPLSRA